MDTKQKIFESIIDVQNRKYSRQKDDKTATKQDVLDDIDDYDSTNIPEDEIGHLVGTSSEAIEDPSLEEYFHHLSRTGVIFRPPGKEGFLITNIPVVYNKEGRIISNIPCLDLL